MKKEALLAAAKALAQASAYLEQAAEDEEPTVEQLNTIASLALVKRDNDLKEMKEKIEEIEDAVENTLPSKISDLEYDLSDVKGSVPDIDAEDFESRLSDVESQIQDLDSDKASEDYADEIRTDLEREIEEIRDNVEPAIELAGVVANHFAPAKEESEENPAPVGPNGNGVSVPPTP